MDYLDASYATMDIMPTGKEKDSRSVHQMASGDIGTSPSKKCGEILVGSHGIFILVCALCTESFNTLRSFGMHIKSQHTKVQLDTGVADTSTLTVDKFNFSTAEDQSHSTNTKRTVAEGFSTQVPQLPTVEDSNSEDCGEDSEGTKEAYNENLSHDIISPGENVSGNKVINTEVNQAASQSERHTKMTCIYCDKIFMDIGAFGQHLSAHTGRKRFVCSFCPKTFYARDDRLVHINQNHTGERPHKCSYCPKSFSAAATLRMHERMHLGIKKYSCDYCDKRFVYSNEKTLHERTHTGEKPYQCEECGRQFLCQAKLTEHMRHHKNIKNYKCQFCDKAFFNSNQLGRHMPVHTKERPFHCKVCGQNFPRRYALRTHMELHSTEKKYVCAVCGKAFRQSAGLYSHKKSHKNTPV